MGHARLIFLLCTPSRGTPAPRLNPAAQLMPSMGEGTVEAAAAGAAGAAALLSPELAGAAAGAGASAPPQAIPTSMSATTAKPTM